MSLKNHENPKIRDACTGALWEIYDSKVPFGIHNDQTEVSRSMSALSIESDAPHVMISYQWDTQERMIAIRDLLIKSGYNVWMDIDQMGTCKHYSSLDHTKMCELEEIPLFIRQFGNTFFFKR